MMGTHRRCITIAKQKVRQVSSSYALKACELRVQASLSVRPRGYGHRLSCDRNRVRPPPRSRRVAIPSRLIRWAASIVHDCCRTLQAHIFPYEGDRWHSVISYTHAMAWRFWGCARQHGEKAPHIIQITITSVLNFQVRPPQAYMMCLRSAAVGYR